MKVVIWLELFGCFCMYNVCACFVFRLVSRSCLSKACCDISLLPETMLYLFANLSLTSSY